MSKRDGKLSVEDILEAIGLIEEYIKNVNIESFKKDRKTRNVVIRNLEIIGEASKFIPEEIKEKHTDID